MFGCLFQKRLKNTVGEGLDPPGGKGCDILSISAKTNRIHGRVKTLPYSKNAVRLEICKLPICRYAESNRYAHIYVNSSQRDSLIVNCQF